MSKSSNVSKTAKPLRLQVRRLKAVRTGIVSGGAGRHDSSSGTGSGIF